VQSRERCNDVKVGAVDVRDRARGVLGSPAGVRDAVPVRVERPRLDRRE
jgi:hypothetical protein